MRDYLALWMVASAGLGYIFGFIHGWLVDWDKPKNPVKQNRPGNDNAPSAVIRPKTPMNGMQAHDMGFRFEDNPFPRHTPDHSIWRDEWLESQKRDQRT